MVRSNFLSSRPFEKVHVCIYIYMEETCTCWTKGNTETSDDWKKIDENGKGFPWVPTCSHYHYLAVKKMIDEDFKATKKILSQRS